jgi:hypothetical protein
MKNVVYRLLAATVATILISSAPLADASERGARMRAADLFSQLDSDLGLNVRAHYVKGLLRRGESTIITTTLSAGNEYYLVAGGCEDAYDVDIAVFDENGNLVGKDDDTDSLAVAKVTPLWSGTFRVRITMYNSTANGAHWVLQYAYR